MMDLGLELWVSSLIELSKLRWMLGSGESWTPGTPLRLLFAGYNGNRNTGADVRVQEMIRQIRRVLGDPNLELSVLSHNLEWSRGYFDSVRQVKLPDVFPPFLFREVGRYHGVVACEGSMFKSKFANALSAMMIGCLGMAAAQNKLAVGFGAEAGVMDRYLKTMCPALLFRFAGDHPQRGIPGRPGRPGSADGAGNRYGLDLRTPRAGIRGKSVERGRLGWTGRRFWDFVPSTPSGGRCGLPWPSSPPAPCWGYTSPVTTVPFTFTTTTARSGPPFSAMSMPGAAALGPSERTTGCSRY